MGDGSIRAENMLRRHLANPFLVLALPPEAAGDQIERQGQKLLMMLSAGIPGADRYQTPLGPRELTADLVREAMAELRDPDRRLVHEWWAKAWGTP